ncbi:hypothetical protein cypCar_00007374 [Cyprinus carpio]|nr:hypothetical protein cypCar_00007374 [Cyprinus carpio]
MASVSVTLENQLHSAQKNLLFLQQDHANTLKGLHAEIRRLQQHCTDLTYELTMRSSDPGELNRGVLGRRELLTPYPNITLHQTPPREKHLVNQWTTQDNVGWSNDSCAQHQELLRHQSGNIKSVPPQEQSDTANVRLLMMFEQITCCPPATTVSQP